MGHLVALSVGGTSSVIGITDGTSRAATNRPAVVCANFAFNDASMDADLNAMIDAGMIVIGGVNNSGLLLGVNDMRPGAVADTIAVGGVGFSDLPYYLGKQLDELGTRQVGTNYGPIVEILGPAQRLKLANASVLGGGYRVWSGNSFSCPFVSGVAACMLQGHTRLSDRTDVQAFNTKLLANATTGKLRHAFGYVPLVDKIAYLDPIATFETF